MGKYCPPVYKIPVPFHHPASRLAILDNLIGDKMGYKRVDRRCMYCGKLINHKTRGTKTCSAECREKRRQMIKNGYVKVN